MVDDTLIKLFFFVQILFDRRVKQEDPQAMDSMDAVIFSDDPSRRNDEEESEEEGEEVVTVEELERRMWRDRMMLRKLKEEKREKEKGETMEMMKKKALIRAQDTVLKNMVKMMEICGARGFVYGIIPEKGKPVSGASDNLRAWWKERVKFDHNGPAAIQRSNFSYTFIYLIH